MMRLVRSASLIVALYLLASAATAYAECAWVAWRQVIASKAARAGTANRPFTSLRLLPPLDHRPGRFIARSVFF